MTNNLYSSLSAPQEFSQDPDVKVAHEAIINFCSKNHNYQFDLNIPVIRLHEPTFASEEINAALDVLLSTRVTMGPKVRSFEKSFSVMHGHADGVTSNSGSSANLLALAAMCNPMYSRKLNPGDEVIVPALSWSTTVWPLIQHGLVPVIVDIDPKTFNIDPQQILKAITPNTKALMLVHVYGNPCEMDQILEICKKNDLLLIEDCCEALGARYKGRYVGTFGEVGTFSFYFSHHITMLEGGITVSESSELLELMRMLRAHGWTRELEGKEEYQRQYPDYDKRFLFVNHGYNLRITELQAAIGLIQLQKLKTFVESRRTITKYWNNTLSKWSNFFDFQSETKDAESSVFGFPLVIKDGAPFNRGEITSFLNSRGIETRPIICGNIAAQPAMNMFNHKVVGDLSNANKIMKDGFSFGNHQHITKEAMNYLVDIIDEFMKTKSVA
jgi:CDP-6-deoxy-D-xylo-4-hexulose-3-dehydrase